MVVIDDISVAIHYEEHRQAKIMRRTMAQEESSSKLFNMLSIYATMVYDIFLY